jgi:hypothetical protein
MVELLFCGDVIHKHMVEEDYYQEFTAANEAGISCNVFDFDTAVDDNNYSKAIKNIPEASKLKAVIYRGWMFTIEQYVKLHHKLLLDKNIELINTPEEYAFCHWLPNCYEVIKYATPKTVWASLGQLPDLDLAALLEPFGNKPIVLKDYVKSAKHYWNTACFIPDASDLDKVRDTMQEFSNVRDGITGGFVFREYRELQQIGVHPISKIPISKEYRLFFLNGELIDMSPYWEEGEYDSELPPYGFGDIAKNVKSSFFSMDVAKAADGSWIVIELGDGQVSGLPVGCDIKSFYKALATG